jgi:polyhydroxybutyrate depolymerase
MGRTPLSGARVILHVLAAGFCAFVLLAGSPLDACACSADLPCLVRGGAYLVRPPAGWDGNSALPTIVFFHGWQQSAYDVMRDATIERVSSDLGVLLVAPDGAGHTWSYPGSPGHYRDEFAFIDAVLDDVETRYPVDRRRLLASGISQGASMVWYAACFLGNRFTAFAPVAGDFWDPPPESCPSGPASIRHIHGLSDETFPTDGRVVADRYRQGNLWQGWALLLRIDGCGSLPDRIETTGDLSCRTWAARSCASGRELVLCLHSRGHVFDAEWLRQAFQWLVKLDSSGLIPPAGPSAPRAAP